MKRLQYIYNRENYISRTPGLFFCEDSLIDERENVVAPSMGCYGKYVYDIKLPNGVYFNAIQLNNNGNMIYEYKINELGKYIRIPLLSTDDFILQAGHIYSYKTLMNVYYSYRNFVFAEESGNYKFIKFIKEGIGSFDLEDVVTEYNTNQDDKIVFDDTNDLLPHQIYIVTVDSLLQELADLKKCCDYKDKDIAMCCNCQKYERMGGDKMEKLLEYLKNKKQNLLNYYYGQAIVDNIQHNCIEWNINLINTSKDLGVLTPFISYWDSKKTYNNGDIVIKDDMTYICQSDDGYNPNKEGCSFEECFKLNQSSNTNEHQEIKAQTSSALTGLRTNDYIDSPINPVNGEDWLCYYRLGVHNRKQKYDELFNIKRLGEKDDEKEDLMTYGDYMESIDVQTYQNTITFTYYINAHLRKNDQNAFTIDNNAILDGVKHIDTFTYEVGSDLENLIYSQESITIRIYKNDKNYIKINDKQTMNIPYSVYCKEIELKELNLNSAIYNIGDYIVDSKEESVTYYQCIQEYNTNYYIEEDKSNFIKNYLTNININKYDSKTTYQYGDIFIKDGKLFMYVDDENHQNLFQQKRIIRSKDNDSYIDYEIRYTLEEYLDRKCKLNEGKTVKIVVNKKYEFSTLDSIENQTIMRYGHNVNFSSIISNYTANIEKDKDFTTTILYKEDYLTGIHYQPQVESNINVDRGNAAAFEYHIKLAEIKSIQDLENYQNGGFFNIEKQ